MKYLPEGISRTQFLFIINSNFVKLATFRNVSQYPTILTTDNYINAINSNFGSTIVSIGMKGSQIASNFCNAVLSEVGGSYFEPSLPTAVWVDDYAQIDFIDASGGIAQHEIYESKNAGAYTLVTTLAAGIVTYKNYTWQNANMNFKIRAKVGSAYSDYCDILNVITPLVWKTDQSTLTQAIIQYLVCWQGTINVNWGDGTSDNLTGYCGSGLIGVPPYAAVHDYSVPKNPYFITLSGDLDKMIGLGQYDQVGFYGDWSKWILPDAMTYLHPFFCNFSGNFPTVIPSAMQIFNIAHNQFTGDISNLATPSTMFDFQIYDNKYICTNPAIWNNFNNTIQHIQFGNEGNFSGDFSGVIIPEGTRYIGVGGGNNNITKLPRGNFKWVSEYNMSENKCSSAEIDSFLAYVDAYFTGGVVPLLDCLYYLNGTGMGTPSAAGLASRTSILGKYTAAGKTCSISVNS